MILWNNWLSVRIILNVVNREWLKDIGYQYLNLLNRRPPWFGPVNLSHFDFVDSYLCVNFKNLFQNLIFFRRDKLRPHRSFILFFLLVKLKLINLNIRVETNSEVSVAIEILEILDVHNRSVGDLICLCWVEQTHSSVVINEVVKVNLAWGLVGVFAYQIRPYNDEVLFLKVQNLLRHLIKLEHHLPLSYFLARFVIN